MKQNIANRSISMYWNNNGKIDAGDYAHYKMMSGSSGRDSGKNTSNSNVTQDSSADFWTKVIVIFGVIVFLLVLGQS